MPNIGDTLREARMRQRLDIADVESRTKIRAKYLRALENEEFAMLPGPTFVKTFLRTYSEALGLDPQALVDQYRATHESRDDVEHLQPLSPTAVARDRRRGGGPRRPRGPWMAIGAAVLAVVAVLAVIGLLSGSDDDGKPRTEPETERPATTETTPTTEQEPAPPRRVTVRVVPNGEVYVCADSGAGSEITFNGILSEPRTFRGRRVRLNIGRTDVQVRVNGRDFPIEPGPEAVGFAFTPGAQRALPLGERPCA